MNRKNNISKFKDCYGCGVCVKACPVNIITLQENKEGFYQPEIQDQDKCIECGRCLKTCAFNHKDVKNDASYEAKAYAAWSNNSIIRQRCSSGGIGFGIGTYAIEQGYKAIGVRYDIKSKRAEHFIASTVEEFQPSIGSKYIPSYMVKALEGIELKDQYLVTGTPCQIDSMRRYIHMQKKEHNYILLDFFCHGVPSLLLWDKYEDQIKTNLGLPTFVSWRNKSTGWHDSYSMEAEIEGSYLNSYTGYDIRIPESSHPYSSRKSIGDMFYKFFLGNYCLNKCCYSTCKYKMLESAADIRIGDFWGDLYDKDEAGVSAVIAMTPKGEEILNELSKNNTVIGHTMEEVCQGQMRKNATKPPIYEKIIAALQGPASLTEISNTIIKPYRRRLLPIRICNRLLRILHLKRFNEIGK